MLSMLKYIRTQINISLVRTYKGTLLATTTKYIVLQLLVHTGTDAIQPLCY